MNSTQKCYPRKTFQRSINVPMISIEKCVYKATINLNAENRDKEVNFLTTDKPWLIISQFLISAARELLRILVESTEYI